MTKQLYSMAQIAPMVGMTHPSVWKHHQQGCFCAPYAYMGKIPLWDDVGVKQIQRYFAERKPFSRIGGQHDS